MTNRRDAIKGAAAATVRAYEKPTLTAFPIYLGSGGGTQAVPPRDCACLIAPSGGVMTPVPTPPATLPPPPTSGVTPPVPGTVPPTVTTPEATTVPTAPATTVPTAPATTPPTALPTTPPGATPTPPADVTPVRPDVTPRVTSSESSGGNDNVTVSSRSRSSSRSRGGGSSEITEEGATEDSPRPERGEVVVSAPEASAVSTPETGAIAAPGQVVIVPQPVAERGVPVVYPASRPQEQTSARPSVLPATGEMGAVGLGGVVGALGLIGAGAGLWLRARRRVRK